jgi:F-type H+-transporting ATPase subunit alpha
MKQVAGRLRLDMAQFRDLAAFAQFGSDLDKATQEQLDRGRRLTEVLKQPQYQPVPLSEQVMIIFAGTRGYLDNVEVDRVKEFEEALLNYLATQHPEIGKDIQEGFVITDELESQLRAAIDEFKVGWA